MEINGLTKKQPRRSHVRPRRFFTFEEANRSIPLVRRIVADIVKQHRKVCTLEERCHIRRPSVSAAEQERLGRQYNLELDRLRDLSEELAAVGCELKDWRRGLVDFAAHYQGREIELCWRLGEEKIEHWHEIGAGFPGRQMIDDEFLGHLRPAVADV